VKHRFQFQYGSIKSRSYLHSRGYIQRFQFQYGSIKSDFNVIVNVKCEGFQFQYGSIKRFLKTPPLPKIIDFNSNMVRLKAL